IDEVGLSLLEHVKEGKPILADELSKKTGLNPMGLATVINSLVRRGYLKEGGLWRREISITEKGVEVLSRLKKS
ncbi:hypothetical protein, partial [Pseudothermotoga sp.]